jgi:predicted nucleotide-binding protein
MELPSDFAGVVWEPFDAHGDWKQVLVRELKAVCFEVDLSKAM